MPEIDKKQWQALREWLAKLHPAVRLKYLKLALRQASDDIRPDIETMIRETEDDLVDSPEWRQFGRPAPMNVEIQELFPALAGPAEEEKTLERRLANLVPAELAEEESEKGANIYSPSPKEFKTDYKPMSSEGYQEAKQGIKELYEKVSGRYEWSKTHGMAPEEVRKIQEESRQILPDAVRIAGGAAPSSEIYRRMLVRTEQMMRTMQGMSERTRQEMETYGRSEREEKKYAS